MIICYINGSPAYPSTSSSIKVTFENAAIKERESRTQELTFNLDIPDNRKVFGAVNRIDVKKSATAFATCRLYADNLLVIEGVGTITSYSDTEVKLQIKTATAASQFPDTFSSLYIDRIVGGLGVGAIDVSAMESMLDANNGTLFITSSYAMPTANNPLIPVYDEANSRWLNQIVVTYVDKYFHPEGGHSVRIDNFAPQPLLSDVIADILFALGYREKGTSSLFSPTPLSFFNQYPWNQLHVVNTNCSYRLRNMIPHWTVEKFFTELSHLFHISFFFDEKTMAVSVGQASTDTSDEVANYECLDEFSSDYDEDGESLLASSNLAYNLSSSSNWNNEQLPQDTLAQFTLDDYESKTALEEAFSGMTEEKKLTHIFRYPRCLAYGRHKTDSDGNKTSDIEIADVPLGNLVRQPESDETLDINIVPVCLAQQDFKIKVERNFSGSDYSYEEDANMAFPTTPETKAMVSEDYVTVEDVVDETDTDKTEEQERMELFVAHGSTAYKAVYYGGVSDPVQVYVAKCFTYDGSNPGYADNITLALCDTRWAFDSIGKLHSQTSKVENHDTIVIKFEADDLPDARKTYVFRGKRFLCDKIELEITANGISRIKTGYFFEIQ